MRKQFTRIIIILALSASVARGQSVRVGAVVSVDASGGAGYGTAVGGGVVGEWRLQDWISAHGFFVIESAPKLYIGDGTAYRGRLEARLAVPEAQFYSLRPFASLGVNYSATATSRYKKQATNAMIGVGVNRGSVWTLRYHYLPRERQTRNEVNGHRLGVDVSLPLAPGSKCDYLIEPEYQRWHFDQFGRGRLAAWSLGLRVGIGCWVR